MKRMFLLIAASLFLVPTRADDFPDTIGTAGLLPEGSSLAGEISRDADRDVFFFLAEPYVPYVVSMTPDTNSLQDAELRIFDSASNLLVRASSTGPRTQALAALPETTRLRRVYVDARSFAEYDQGHYALSLNAQAVIDVDADDLPDAFEDVYGLSTESSGPEDVHGALGDADGDGLNNQDEMFAGTNPMASDSAVRVSRFVEDPLEGSVEWPAVPSAWYRLEASDALAPPDWRPVLTLQHTSTVPGVLRVVLPAEPTVNEKFYRILYLPD